MRPHTGASFPERRYPDRALQHKSEMGLSTHVDIVALPFGTTQLNSDPGETSSSHAERQPLRFGTCSDVPREALRS